MVVNNIYVTNATKITLSDRFTILQGVRPVTVPQRQRRNSVQELEFRNRRLLERLALKPIAQAATSVRKIPVKQRIGVLNRINSPRKGSSWNLSRKNQNSRRSLLLRRTNTFTNVRQTRQFRRKKLQRFNSVGNLSRSNSMGNISQGGIQNRNFRRGRGQARQFNNNNYQNLNSQPNNNLVRGRGTRRRGLMRGQSGNQEFNETNMSNTTMSRGRGRNQRRGINRSWFAQKSLTKDELDKQLDQYMAGARSQLDKELDSYMSAMDIDASFL